MRADMCPDGSEAVLPISEISMKCPGRVPGRCSDEVRPHMKSAWDGGRKRYTKMEIWEVSVRKVKNVTSRPFQFEDIKKS